MEQRATAQGGLIMSEILRGVLNIPPSLWDDSPIDKMQRYSRYKEAAERIELLEYVAKSLLEYIDAIPSDEANKFPIMPGIDRDFDESASKG